MAYTPDTDNGLPARRDTFFPLLSRPLMQQNGLPTSKGELRAARKLVRGATVLADALVGLVRARARLEVALADLTFQETERALRVEKLLQQHALELAKLQHELARVQGRAEVEAVGREVEKADLRARLDQRLTPSQTFDERLQQLLKRRGEIMAALKNAGVNEEDSTWKKMDTYFRTLWEEMLK